MRIKLVVGAIVACCLTSPAFAVDQFDLNCTAKNEAQHYRLDLAKMEYCFGSCLRIQKIQEVTSGYITLFKIEPKFRNDEEGWNTINRVTGEWSWYNSDPSISSHVQDIRGACVAGPFSGFPSANRKF